METTKQQLSIEEVMNVFYARDFAYDILRRFFVEEPSEEYLKPFVYQNMIDLFPFKEDRSEIQEGIDDIKAYLAEFDPVHKRTDFEDLHWDYTKMFIGPGEITAFPWESVYVSKDKLLFQETTLEVRKIYEKYAFQTADYIEADDHIGLELDFMYRLNQLCIQSGESITPNSLSEIRYLLNEQQTFLKNHLSRFVPQFSESVVNNADTKFYVGLAKILQHFIALDSIVLNELLNIDFIQK
ncbi:MULTISPECIES: TorD/DmsD family molecular chaperone [Bacillus]|uniref:TorD/DmsD family molecular chaperone n=1 Tax=Bacillus TaxID=1386 RepID=UPI000308C0C1|nr:MULTISPECIES: molecular chaperone TorD family protein [Bacillus]